MDKITLNQGTMDIIPLPAFLIDKDQVLIYGNKNAAALFGMESPMDFRGNHIQKYLTCLIFDPESRSYTTGAPADQKEILGICKIKTDTGDDVPVEVMLSSMDTDGIVQYLLLIKDATALMNFQRQISNQKQELDAISQQLEHMGSTDSLTGLKNRRVFFHQLEAILHYTQRYKQPISLILLDLDGFKRINDQYGHQKGDQIIQRFSDILRSQSRESDCVARYGGTEFCLILPNTDKTGALTRAENLRKTVEAFQWGVSELTVSMGVSSLTDQALEPLYGLDLSALFVKNADAALSVAKQKGKNRVVHFDSLS